MGRFFSLIKEKPTFFFFFFASLLVFEKHPELLALCSEITPDRLGGL